MKREMLYLVLPQGALKLRGENYFTDSLSLPTPKLLDNKINTGHLNFLDTDGIIIPLEIKSLLKQKKHSLL
jgi:hypothetical protein